VHERGLAVLRTRELPCVYNLQRVWSRVVG